MRRKGGGDKAQMCAIIGFTFNDSDLARQMCRVVAHRGPDDEGYYSDTGITLGHRRLSIIDLETGWQPIPNENETIWIVFNGEIYNFRELRQTLEQSGHRFQTSTDTEVIVHAYEQWGRDCVQYLNGMFAFAIYDVTRNELFLARDRAGMKPLHYTLTDDGRFLFASEIKSLLQCSAVVPKMNPQGLHFTINLRYVPGSWTMFNQIRRVLPGQSMVVDVTDPAHGIFLKKYWSPVPQYGDKTEGYYVRQLRAVLERAVRQHLVADVPVGVMLSGGLDSTSIVALASKMVDEPLQTFTMGFGHDTDENGDARFVADHFGTDHHEITVNGSLLKDYPTMIWYADEPKRNLYPYYISQLVGQHVKTALGGLGSDELFAGYIFKYKFAESVNHIREQVHRGTREDIAKAANNVIEYQTNNGDIVHDEHLDYLEMVRSINNDTDLYLICQTQDKVFDPRYQEKIYGPRLLTHPLVNIRDVYKPYFSNGGTFIDNILLADFSEKLPCDFLLVDDRMCMAHSVESRSPFLDTELLHFAFTIPPSMKLTNGTGKHLLRQAMNGLLPKEVFKKGKQGFASGIYDVYLKEGREMVESLVRSGRLVEEKYLSPAYIDRILSAIPNPRLELHYGVLWNILTAEIWYRLYIDGDVRNPSLNMQKVEQ